MPQRRAIHRVVRENCVSPNIIVKFRINWALSNSLNTYNRHSDWQLKLEVYATNVSIYFYDSLYFSVFTLFSDSV